MRIGTSGAAERGSSEMKKWGDRWIAGTLMAGFGLWSSCCVEPCRAGEDSSAQGASEVAASVVIVELELRQASPREAVDALIEAAPQGTPVNFVTELQTGKAKSTGSKAAPPSPRSAESGPRITMRLRNVTLLDAIRYVTEAAGLEYRIDENAVVIHSPGVAAGRIETRIYPVDPAGIEAIFDDP